MTKKEIIAGIRVLTDFRAVTLKEIETTLGMPKNCLSGMLNGSRGLPNRWQKPLTAYIKAKTDGAKEIVIPIPTSKDPEAIRAYKKVKHSKLPKEAAPSSAIAPGTELIVLPKNEEIKKMPLEEKIPGSSKSPPTGMTRSEQLRWLRENNQNLR